jgi:hypothetical protein
MQKFVSTQSTKSLHVWAMAHNHALTSTQQPQPVPTKSSPHSQPYLLRPILILSPHPIPDHLSSLLQLTFSHYLSPACACHITNLAHLTLLHLITLITSGEEYKLRHFSLHHYFNPALTLWAGPWLRSRYSDSLRAEQPGDQIPVGRDLLHMSRSALCSTQPPIQWALGLFPGDKVSGVWSLPLLTSS